MKKKRILLLLLLSILVIVIYNIILNNMVEVVHTNVEIESLPEEFQDFVEACHQNNIGVLVDWVPGHYTQIK